MKTDQKTPKSILLVYEEIPERTVIALLNGADLAAANLSATEVASTHSQYLNNTDMSEAQQDLCNKVGFALLGEYDEDAEVLKSALWKDKIIFDTREPALCREGMPPEITGDTVVVHTGFAL